MSVTYENLDIWKDSIELVSNIYKITKKFPKDELFGIVSQIRRAGVSVPSNIAEGSGRGTKKEFSRFVDISVGSLNEVESLVHVSYNLEYITKGDFDNLLDKIKNLGTRIGGFRKYLNK